MNLARSGHYPIARSAGEIERLFIQSAAMAPDAAIMLERIGVAPGWACLDLGCGPGGITALMKARVGALGRVVGLDADPAMLEHARAAVPGVEFVAGDAYRTGLPAAGFDLVHMRFLAGTAGSPDALIAEAMRLARPDGVVALQEADTATLECYPPHPAWTRLRAACEAVFVAAGSDIAIGRRLYALARRAGLADVQYRPFLIGVHAGEPMTDYLPSIAESMRGTLLTRGPISAAELDAAIAECRAHLAKPDTIFTTCTIAQVWGRVVGADPRVRSL